MVGDRCEVAVKGGGIFATHHAETPSSTTQNTTIFSDSRREPVSSVFESGRGIGLESDNTEFILGGSALGWGDFGHPTISFDENCAEIVFSSSKTFEQMGSKGGRWKDGVCYTDGNQTPVGKVAENQRTLTGGEEAADGHNTLLFPRGPSWRFTEIENIRNTRAEFSTHTFPGLQDRICGGEENRPSWALPKIHSPTINPRKNHGKPATTSELRHTVSFPTLKQYRGRQEPSGTNNSGGRETLPRDIRESTVSNGPEGPQEGRSLLYDVRWSSAGCGFNLQCTHQHQNLGRISRPWQLQRRLGRQTVQSNSGSREKNAIRVGDVLNKILTAKIQLKNAEPASEEEMKKYPIHVKDVARVNWDLAGETILEDLKPSWDWAKHVLTGKHELTPINRSEILPANISELDLKTLIKYDIVCELPQDLTPLGTVKLWTIVEAPKHRRRLIVEPRAFNEKFLYAGECELPMLEALIPRAAETEGAMRADFAAYYNSFALSREAWSYYTFEFRSKVYCMKVICTGQRQCPALAQALTKSLAHKAAVKHLVVEDAYIDNVRFAGEQSECEAAYLDLQNLCLEIGITLNETEPFSAQYEFLGVCYDHTKKTVGLSKRTCEKLFELRRQWEQCTQQFTMRDVLKTLGLLVWCARILQKPLAYFYYLIKFLRRSSGLKVNDLAHVWPSLIPRVTALINDFLLNHQRTLVTAEPAPVDIVFTDASLEGWAVLWFHGSEAPRIWAGSWSAIEDIQILEGRALMYASELLPMSMHPTNLLIFVDNSSVIGAFRKSRSANFILNNLIMRILETFGGKGYVTQISYIKSELNPADHPSRDPKFAKVFKKCSMFGVS